MISKKKYTKNVHYLGYVPEKELHEIFEKATFSLMLFKDYKFYKPFSGSILYNLKKGKIIFTNHVNAIGEIITNAKNGFYLSGQLNSDVDLITQVLGNTTLVSGMKEEIYRYMLANHTPKAISKKMQD